MNLSCDIIRDLLPLYAEELASPDSVAAVREHLGGCEDCHAELEMLKQPVPVPTDAPGMGTIKKELRRRRWTAVLYGMLCGMLSILLVVSSVSCWLLNPIYLPETVVTAVEQSDKLDGWVRIWASAPPEGHRWMSCDGREWEDGTQYVVFYTCRFLDLMRDIPFEEYVSVRPGDGNIWLFSETGPMVLLHGTGGDAQPPAQWSMLERLSHWAAISGGILLVLGLFLRKMRAGRWAMSLGALGISYALCQWVVCGGSFRSFFWKRELLWAVLIAGCIWGIGMCICGMRRKQ